MTQPPSSFSENQLFDGLCTIRWLGTNCLVIKAGDTCLIVDPHFSRPAIWSLLHKISPRKEIIQKELDRLGIKKMDAVLVTHTHYDHFLDAVELAGMTQADLFGSESAVHAAGNALPLQRIHQVESGRVYSIGDICVSFYLSSHLELFRSLANLVSLNGNIDKPLLSPAWFWQYKAGTIYSILLEIDGHKLLIQGSAGIEGNNSPPVRSESAVLSIAGLGYKSRQYRQEWFKQSVIQTGVREVYFTHWDNFFIPWNSSPRDFLRTRQAIRSIEEMSAACPEVKFQRLIPG